MNGFTKLYNDFQKNITLSISQTYEFSSLAQVGTTKIYYIIKIINLPSIKL